VKRYDGEHIEVSYDAARCLHAAACVRGIPAVFDTAKRPWIAPDAADAEAIAAVIRRCPTGALHYALRAGEPEQPSVPTRVRLPEGGPLLLEGDLELEGKRETRAAICRCGRSSNEPYCDHGGACQQWEYEPGS
jgi:uncharacterized Fe-S cluster protein YjdI